MDASLWLFLPTYNEAGNLESVVRASAAQLEGIAPGDWRLLVVDDASPDGTGELADRLAEEIDGVEVLHRQIKEGLGRAYLAGFARAVAGGAEFVVVMDADYSHDPAHLPALVAAADECDLVVGSRYVDGGRIADWPRLRRLLSRAGSAYARRMLGVDIRDLTSGFRCVRREVLETVEPSTLRAQGYVFNIELTYRALRAGFEVREVPDLLPRPQGGREQDVAADRRRGPDARTEAALAAAVPRAARNDRRRAGGRARSGRLAGRVGQQGHGRGRVRVRVTKAVPPAGWALALYLALSLAFFGLPVAGDLGSTAIAADDIDASAYMWFFSWWPHALLNGLDPIRTELIFVPDGYNLAWTTAMPGPSLVLAPVTLALGPLATWNTIMLLAPALGAWTAFLLCRELTGAFAPSLVGGYLFGFSPYVLGNLQGGPNLVLVALLPVFVLLVVRHARGAIGARPFVVLMTLALSFQFLTSTEVLAMAGVFGAITLAAAFALLPEWRGRLIGTIKLLAIASLAAIVLVSPLLWFMLFEPHTVPEQALKGFPADLASWFVPSPYIELATGHDAGRRPGLRDRVRVPRASPRPPARAVRARGAPQTRRAGGARRARRRGRWRRSGASSWWPARRPGSRSRGRCCRGSPASSTRFRCASPASRSSPQPSP